jgi:hypothetical protein
MIGICLSDGHFMSFPSRRCIFLCLLISPSALNDHHPGERKEQSRLVTFLPNRDQGWTAAPCNIFIIFAQRREGGKIVCLFLFCSTSRCVYGIEWTVIVFCSQPSLLSRNTNQCDIYKRNRSRPCTVLSMRSSTLFCPDSGKSHSSPAALIPCPSKHAFIKIAIC